MQLNQTIIKAGNKHAAMGPRHSCLGPGSCLRQTNLGWGWKGLVFFTLPVSSEREPLLSSSSPRSWRGKENAQKVSKEDPASSDWGFQQVSPLVVKHRFSFPELLNPLRGAHTASEPQPQRYGCLRATCSTSARRKGHFVARNLPGSSARSVPYRCSGIAASYSPELQRTAK